MIKKIPTFQATSVDAFALQYELKELELILDTHSGHLSYGPKFMPLKLDVELVLVRHGETYGNCGQVTNKGTIDQDAVKFGVKDREKRVFQGNIDTELNQLTALGKKQAEELALRLESELLAKNWEPNVILYSPLSRAKQTGMPFIERNDFTSRYFPCNEIKEISYGAWENRRICDMEFENPCHLFYLTSHALVKSSGINVHGMHQNGECFAEVVIRAHNILREIEQKYAGKKVLMFSHSMFGAACCILFGRGQKVENENYLAFDGRRQDGSLYVLPFAVPLFLNFELESGSY